MPMLVSPAWLSAELANGFGFDRDQVVLEVGCGAPDRAEHIPRSTWMDTNEIETGERCWRLVEDTELLRRFGGRGISQESTVVVAGEPLAAARAAWALTYAGVRSVKILDGGFRRWIAEHGSLTRGWRAPPPIAFGPSRPLGARVRATRDDVRSMIASGSITLADVRSRGEHEGSTSGYSYIAARGRIEGSVFARGGPNANHLEDYTLADGRFAECDRIEAMWRELGICKRACFYCGTGWRASVAFLFAEWLGFEHASVYDGGWFEWTGGTELARTGCG